MNIRNQSGCVFVHHWNEPRRYAHEPTVTHGFVCWESAADTAEEVNAWVRENLDGYEGEICRFEASLEAVASVVWPDEEVIERQRSLFTEELTQ